MTAGRVSTGERLYRAHRIGSTVTRIYLGARARRFLAERLRPTDMEARWQDFNRASARSIYEAAIELRGLILKGCQFLGSRPDLLPREYVDVLSRLQDRVPASPFSLVRQSVERELGAPLPELFADFSPLPVASASLAQVHEARLHGGERVAVKVQYPEIAERVKGDLANLRLLFRTLGWLDRDVDLMPIVDELQATVPRELDFLNEGRNAERMAALFAGRDDVAVPRIHWSHSTRRVLTLDFVEGIKVSDRAALERAGVDVQQVTKTLAETYCAQVLVHGFFHADPHPGNLRVQPGPGGARLVYLDFGLAVELPASFRKGVVGVAASVLRADPEGLAEALLDLGFETRDGSWQAIRDVAGDLLRIVQAVQDRSYLDREATERAVRELAEGLRRNPIVRVPSHVVMVARVLGLLSGVSHALGSQLDVAATLLPFALATPPPPRA